MAILMRECFRFEAYAWVAMNSPYLKPERAIKSTLSSSSATQAVRPCQPNNAVFNMGEGSDYEDHPITVNDWCDAPESDPPMGADMHERPDQIAVSAEHHTRYGEP
jgi:hypothetical protein